jgi:hypothetical protein
MALNLDLSPPDQEGWFGCEVTVEVPGFSGHFRCDVWRVDLQSFQRQIREMIDRIGSPSTANLAWTDPGIDLHFSMNTRGQILGRYVFQNFDTTGQATLSGEFQMDQSYLPGLSAQVAEVLRQPPI